MRVTLWHNPRCTTSRKALALLEGKGADVAVVDYTKGKQTREDWAVLVDALGGDPTRLLRAREPLYKDLKLEAKIRAGKVGREQVIDLLTRHPMLLERPVVVASGRALIARPAERAADAL
jgi:arsenate reductase (glutaredoxin)